MPRVTSKACLLSLIKSAGKVDWYKTLLDSRLDVKHSYKVLSRLLNPLRRTPRDRLHHARAIERARVIDC